MPDSRRSATTSSMKPLCWSWSGDRLTLSASVSSPGQAVPRHDLMGGGLQDRSAEGDDLAVLLRQADEVGRVDDAAGRVAPADQRLDADDPAGRQLDDRLVVDGEVAAADAPAQVGVQLVSLDDGAMHLRVEDLGPALAVGLGPVHRDVGIAQELVDELAAAGDADPDAAADDDVGPRDRERQLEGDDDALGQGHGVLDGRALAGQDRELVAAEARQQVALAQLRPDALGDVDEQLVARRVTERVVDHLEVVEVEEDDAGRRGRVARADEPALDLLDEEGPVAETRQRVVIGLVPELLLEP